MTKKRKALEALVKYFVEKGKVMTRAEYGKQTDVPIRPVVLARTVGSWTRTMSLLEHNYGDSMKLARGEIQGEKEAPKVKPTPTAKVEPKKGSTK